MPHKSGLDPTQTTLFPLPLESKIPADAEVRLIAAFVDQLDLGELGFKQVNKLGAAAYAPALLLKLYIYGYLNRVRSSRRLERECRVNIELHWLLGELKPKYHTIADFRKNHSVALKRVFKEYVLLLKDWELIAGRRLAADGTKIHAQNSRKRNLNDKAIERHLLRLDKNIERSLQEFADRDVQEDSELKKELQENVQEKLAALKQRKGEYEKLRDHLAASDETQISLTDPDARSLIKKGRESLVGYNIQSVVDDEHHLIVHVEATNTTDINALGGLAKEAKATLAGTAAGTDQEQEAKITAPDRPEFLADKGYHAAAQLQAVEDLGFAPYVAERKQVRKGQNPDSYGPEEFTYDAEKDVYTCPAKKELSTTGKLYQRRGKKTNSTGESGGQGFRYYRSPRAVCEACSLRAQCLSSGEEKNRKGKTLTRQEHAAAVERNRERLKNNPDVYRQRQAIVEHPFGTIKRHWTGYYTLLKGKEKVDGEYNLFALCYNLRRSISILGVLELIERLKGQNLAIYLIFMLRCLMKDHVATLLSHLRWRERAVRGGLGLAA